MSLNFLSSLKLGDILVIETYLFWSSYAFDVLHDTVVFKLFSGSKLRCQQLDRDIFAYQDWFDPKFNERLIVSSGVDFCDYRVSGFDGPGILDFNTGLEMLEFNSEYASGFIDLGLIISNLPALIEARSMLLNFAEFDLENDFPSFIECHYFY